jgi:N-acetylglutamate synthase-like GNAT family acetyltransferase
MRVRAATAGDVDAIARLLAQLGYPATPDRVAPRLERLRAAGDELLVAEVQGTVVGLANLHVSPSLEYDAPAGKLGALVVDERHRRAAVGRALVAAVEARARERGCGLLFLTTAERRSDAHAFYERLGFERTGRRYAKRFG